METTTNPRGLLKILWEFCGKVSVRLSVCPSYPGTLYQNGVSRIRIHWQSLFRGI